MRKETRCRHIGYSFRLTARVILYAPSHRQGQWVHPLKDWSDDPSHHERTLLPRSYISLLFLYLVLLAAMYKSTALSTNFFLFELFNLVFWFRIKLMFLFELKEGNALFNDALNTFYMANHERTTLLPRIYISLLSLNWSATGTLGVLAVMDTVWSSFTFSLTGRMFFQRFFNSGNCIKHTNDKCRHVQF